MSDRTLDMKCLRKDSAPSSSLRGAHGTTKSAITLLRVTFSNTPLYQKHYHPFKILPLKNTITFRKQCPSKTPSRFQNNVTKKHYHVSKILSLKNTVMFPKTLSFKNAIMFTKQWHSITLSHFENTVTHTVTVSRTLSLFQNTVPQKRHHVSKIMSLKNTVMFPKTLSLKNAITFPK
jgi:hypothetical protein